jgi:hypothetical protein
MDRFPGLRLACFVPFCAVALLGLVSGRVVAQRTADDTAAPEPTVIGVIGASVSAGFVDPRPRADGERNRTVPLRAVLEPLWDPDLVTIRDRSDLSTFLDPKRRQAPRIERLLGEEPGLVVGLDFPFWFGYGYVGSSDSQAKRLSLQADGLALLSGFACTVVVGDYPDMRGADERMLNPRQIPSEEELAALNAKLRAWAAERDDVLVFPLAAWVAELKTEGVDVEWQGDTVRLEPRHLLQSDRLHASRLGMAVLAERLGRFLREGLPADSPLRPVPVEFETLVEAAGAAFEMTEIVEATESAREPEPAEVR